MSSLQQEPFGTRRPRTLVLLMAISLLAVLAPIPGSAQADDKIVIATGRKTGTYYKVAARLAKISTEPEIQGIEVLDTDGSEDNLERLRNGEARFAFVQLDVFANDHDRGQKRNLAVLGAVFVEYLHILVRYPLELDSIRNLPGMTVWRGREGSGTRFTTDLLFDITGISPHKIDEIDDGSENRLPFPQLESVLDSRNLDVAFLVTTKCEENIHNYLKNRQFSLYPLDPATLRRMEKHETILVDSIAANTYSNQTEEIRTIAVPALLVSRSDESDGDLLQTLLEGARQAWAQISREAESRAPGVDVTHQRRPKGICTEPTAENVVADLEKLGLEVHDATTKKSSMISKKRAIQILSATLGLVVLLAFARWTRKSKWYQRARLDKFAVGVLSALIISILFITFLTYEFENAINPHFSTPTESLWSITIYLFSGLEDRNPYTTKGRITATFGLILGPLFFAAMTGWLANYLIKREKRMPRNLADHYLILNWSERAIDLAREIQHPVITEERGKAVIVVLTFDDSLSVKDLKEAGSGRSKIFEDFYLSVGDPTDELALLNANAQDARAIIILANEKAGDHADEATIRSIIMLRRIAKDHGIKNLHVIAEIVNTANDAVMDEVSKDFPGHLERVSGLRIRNCLLAQAALNEGIVDFYVDLLRVTGDTNEVYVEPIPESAVGMTFRDYGARILQVRSKENPMIPVGVQRQDDHGRKHLFCNPRLDGPAAKLQKGDGIVLLAYEPIRPEDLPSGHQ